jgi:hypothetical protein
MLFSSLKYSKPGGESKAKERERLDFRLDKLFLSGLVLVTPGGLLYSWIRNTVFLAMKLARCQVADSLYHPVP